MANTRIYRELTSREFDVLDRARERLLRAVRRHQRLIELAGEAQREREEAREAMQDLVELVLEGEPPAGLTMDDDVQALVVPVGGANGAGPDGGGG